MRRSRTRIFRSGSARTVSAQRETSDRLRLRLARRAESRDPVPVSRGRRSSGAAGVGGADAAHVLTVVGLTAVIAVPVLEEQPAHAVGTTVSEKEHLMRASREPPPQRFLNSGKSQFQIMIPQQDGQSTARPY